MACHGIRKTVKSADPIVEEWKPVIGFESTYEVSSLGRVRSKERVVVGRKSTRVYKGIVLSPGLQSNNYLGVWLCLNAKRISRLIHHLVAEAFIGPRPDKMDVDHIDGNKTNNKASNLRYLLISDNRNVRGKWIK